MKSFTTQPTAGQSLRMGRFTHVIRASQQTPALTTQRYQASAEMRTCPAMENPTTMTTMATLTTTTEKT